jgi:hypothetical protein
LRDPGFAVKIAAFAMLPGGQGRGSSECPRPSA